MVEVHLNLKATRLRTNFCAVYMLSSVGIGAVQRQKAGKAVTSDPMSFWRTQALAMRS